METPPILAHFFTEHLTQPLIKQECPQSACCSVQKALKLKAEKFPDNKKQESTQSSASAQTVNISSIC